MHSPLPDSSVLEAGILEDERPSRLSRVQDNVRNLLRTSRFGTVGSTPPGSPSKNLPETPVRAFHQHVVVSNPTAETPASSTSSTPTTQPEAVPGVLFPPTSYQHIGQQMAHQSSLFNTRAVAALNHPDLTDPSLGLYLSRKAESRQRHAWKRSKNGRRRQAAVELGSSHCFLCVSSALLLAATVATYVVLASTSSDVTPTFHILFVLGIILATIVCAHTFVRLFLLGNEKRSKKKVLILPIAQRKRRHHHRERAQQQRLAIRPALLSDATDFVPATPIRVHMPADEVRPDSRDAQPTATADLEPPPLVWDKDGNNMKNPPPAYGRWRGSVRANPDLLHWQAVSSPQDPGTPALPSPTYEEAMAAGRTGPPSYVTRDSPARRREVREAGPEANLQAVEPEMVEVGGAGLGV